jgi:2-polyprenyl-3-methyl-5-hydroxy-6-metoxy-1,4-benzoquinol methylase
VPLYAARKDIGFYVGEATAARGPVLELGCGTGRIVLPIARAGSTVVGLDRSR